MADFRQLALTYVLTDNEAELQGIAKEAAAAIQEAPRASNPVARWVESIRNWISSDDDQMEDGEDGEASGDVIARSKAMSFLAATLEILPLDVLKTEQVNLLIAFFGSLFKLDQKAGILPATRALARVAIMTNFQAQKAEDILQSVYSLGEDFKTQVSETRLAIYELCARLFSNAKVANDLQYRHGPMSNFMTQLLQLCRNERDPKCLLQWFGILRIFLAEFSPAPEIVEEIFGIFSAYFPISLRASNHPSGITADQLKASLRDCFSAHYRVSKLAIPYLLEKLDQGESVSVNVKLDILRTLKACVDKYEHVEQGVAPYADKIWSSLKYEVRNGEIEETIKATMEVIRSLSSRLTGTDLRDFAITVQRDCLEDLANSTYTAAVGKLLVSVHSAKLGAFALMVSPTITHIKENLRHPKSPEHTNSLLGLLNSLLEVRLSLLEPIKQLSSDDKQEHMATETLFTSLYSDAYLLPFKEAIGIVAKPEEITIGKKAIEGMGLLVRQPSIQHLDGPSRLLPEGTCDVICSDLSRIVLNLSNTPIHQEDPLSALVQVATISLQKAIAAYPSEFEKIVDDAFEFLKDFIPSSEESTRHTTDILQTRMLKLAFIGCSELPKHGDKFANFLLLLSTSLKQLDSIFGMKAHPSIWPAFASGIQATIRYFGDACQEYLPEAPNVEYEDARFRPGAWLHYVTTTFPTLPQIDGSQPIPFSVHQATAMELDQEGMASQLESQELHARFSLISLFVTRQLYRRATKVVAYANDTELTLELSADFSSGNLDATDSEDQYLSMLATMATYVIRKLNKHQQASLMLHEDIVTLFRGDDIFGSNNPSGMIRWEGAQVRDAMLRTHHHEESYNIRNPPTTPVSGFSSGRKVVLSLGVLQSLHPTAIKPMFVNGVGHGILLAGLLPRDPVESSRSQYALDCILTILANKYPVDDLGSIFTMMEAQLDFVLNEDIPTETEAAQVGILQNEANQPVEDIGTQSHLGSKLAGPVYAITAGILRQYRGRELTAVLQKIRQAPENRAVGYILARSLELLFGPYNCLTKEHYAQIKPLWTQRAYFEIIKPMLPNAWPKVAEDAGQRQTIANYSIAVLSAVKHLPFGVYEDDAEDLIRLILCTVRYLPIGQDVEAGLEILKEIASEAPEKLHSFLNSIMDASFSVLNKEPASKADDLSWMVQGYIQPDQSSVAEANCRALIVRLLGQLAGTLHNGATLKFSPRVRRMLALASGDKFREVRKAALVARAAWADVK